MFQPQSKRNTDLSVDFHILPDLSSGYCLVGWCLKWIQEYRKAIRFSINNVLFQAMGNTKIYILLILIFFKDWQWDNGLLCRHRRPSHITLFPRGKKLDSPTPLDGHSKGGHLLWCSQMAVWKVGMVRPLSPSSKCGSGCKIPRDHTAHHPFTGMWIIAIRGGCAIKQRWCRVWMATDYLYKMYWRVDDHIRNVAWNSNW